MRLRARQGIGLLFFIAAHAPALQDSPAPTFSAATRLVQVDVVARSRSAPATGLTKDDFTLFDNGKPQKISFFSVRSSRISGADAQPAAVPLPPGAVSNRLERDGDSPANATVLFIDQRNTPQAVQGFAIQRIVKFVETRRSKDRIGIYTFTRDSLVRVVQELTDDAELLRQAARGLRAKDPTYETSDTTGMTEHAAQGFAAIQLMERGMGTKHAFQEIARHLANAPGRKSLVWITTSFPLFNLTLGIDFRPDMEEAARTLNEANVALYAVDGRGLQGALSGMTAIPNAESRGAQSLRQLAVQMHRGEGDSLELATMNMLAGLTGGLVFYNKSNAIEESLQSAVDDSELTCALGFYPMDDQDGTWHNLKVGVTRRGVSVRYRENYFASKTPASADNKPTLESLLADPLDATQLALDAEVLPDHEVRTTIDLHNIHLEHVNNQWVGAVDVSFLMEGCRTARTITRKSEIPDAQLATALERGIAVDDSIAWNGPAGEPRGVLHIVAQDRVTGAAGSVRVPLIQR